MIGYTINNRGRYKCDYCDHSTYKTLNGILNHVEQNHAVELERDTAIKRAKDAEREKDDLQRKLSDANKPKFDKPKKLDYWYLDSDKGVYCASCKAVNMGVGIPVGQTIENTPHTCGNQTLNLVLEIKYGR